MAFYEPIGHRHYSTVSRKTACKCFYCCNCSDNIRFFIKVMIETNVNISNELIFSWSLSKCKLHRIASIVYMNPYMNPYRFHLLCKQPNVHVVSFIPLILTFVLIKTLTKKSYISSKIETVKHLRAFLYFTEQRRCPIRL